MKHWLLVLGYSLLVASCSWVPTPDGNHAMLVGGKGHLEYAPGGVMAYTYSNEKSFQHAMQAATSLAASAALGAIGKAKEVTAQTKDTNAANVATNASNNAAATAQAAEALKAKTAITQQALPLATDVKVLPITPP